MVVLLINWVVFSLVFDQFFNSFVHGRTWITRIKPFCFFRNNQFSLHVFRVIRILNMFFHIPRLLVLEIKKPPLISGTREGFRGATLFKLLFKIVRPLLLKKNPVDDATGNLIKP